MNQDEVLLKVKVAWNDDVTIASIISNDDGELICTGSAKRHRSDSANPDIGVLYAMGRAFRALGDELIEEADRMVRDADRYNQAGVFLEAAMAMDLPSDQIAKFLVDNYRKD